MTRLRAAWRLLRAALHGVHGLALVLLLFGQFTPAQRQVRIAWWSAKLLRLMGVQLQMQGAPRPGAKLLVANHVSWLDIMAIHAVCPEARFVSKADVQHWPLANRLVAAAGTLYLQRESRRDALRVVHQMAQALADDDTVALFPEGTTGAGGEPLPFHANLLQAAIVQTVPVQPVALRYAQPGERFSVAAQFVGDTTLAQSLWRLACAQGVVLHLQWLPAQTSTHADRRALAATLRGQIADALRVELAA